MKLSILIPSIPSRFARLKLLWEVLTPMVEGLPVEILVFMDNKKRSVGLKRDALVQMAKGQYLSFVDDDDRIYSNYVTEMLGAIKKGPDVVSIQQHATINDGNKFLVSYGLNNENQEARKVNGVWVDVDRKPFHTCAWKTEIAKRHHFPDASYGEDWHWCERVLKDVRTETVLTAPIMCYHWNEDVTEAELIYP